ncbi:inter-alpha-trypsin inhibitor heavy chain H5 [Syngnathus scovelli]|uniref:inter-alpha-trypsin inhibitor heavy chain H5 n=1 Tax=Syngnathus scovelli TaxID=161590 RepID=UPI00210FB19D|nr:inter-alpha-trypsin inhibitor heavy chain H5 [Syngnathus scovelli]XP_049616303.1 inter-alpha-trypsin inhibitor heavy chain H5 [Syngnathus scovelli]XP_049616304.1 inter-alpha-trypsin inhibitor heavy chain H5 [Syngnathus scovelli]
MKTMLLLASLLLRASCALGQVDHFPPGDHLDDHFDLNMAPHRVPRQVKNILVKEARPHVQELSVNTTVISRYAFTAVRCVMLNRHAAAGEGVFLFPVPAGAFVSNFTMIIAGRVYRSRVAPKERRSLKRPDGKARDKESGDPSSEVFRMGASIPGGERAVFLLEYEELLRRRLGRYEHVTGLRPLQLVSRLRVDVTVVDHLPITALEVLPLRRSGGTGPARAAAKTDPPVTTTVRREKNACKVTFSPNIIQQAKITTDGILGDFVVRYDVRRDTAVGDVRVQKGHFVHYFAPKGLPAVPKNVVFVIDTSASMLGAKIKQTKDALLAILRDLRAVDRFNLISFSNKIKVWRASGPVPVTPLNIRDAKKFIYALMPSGGSNTDGAIQSASALFRERLDGVSLVIFLTDGRPTVGESESAAILGNTRSAARDKFCVFTVGIGADADYKLLERMALENCGATKRIRQGDDAGAMLRSFYEEMATPLLSHVRMDYVSADGVTRRLYANYFNGSELVVAGKSGAAEALRVRVTADNDDKKLVLETDVALRRRESEADQLVKAAARSFPESREALKRLAADLAERVWAFLTLKEELRSRLLGRTSREREEHVRRATDLSLAYRFLTPLTNMLVDEVSSDGDEAPDDVEEEGTLREEADRQSLTLGSGGRGQVDRRPAKKSLTISKTSADGDPHFVVDFPLSKTAVCFNINGEPGHVLRLLSDHKFSGVTVNGKLIGTPPPAGSRKRRRTYFSSIAVVVDRPRRAYVEVTPTKVILDGADRLVLPCRSSASVESGALSLAIVGGRNVTLRIGARVALVVLLHLYKNPAPYQRDHLGFYIQDSEGLSPGCHGLLGQFLHQEVSVVEGEAGDRPSSALLKVRGRSVPVVRKSRRIYGGAHSVDCWFAGNNGAKVVDGRYEDYVASHMFDTGDGPHGSNA